MGRSRERGIEFHALRTRQAGARSFVSVHVLVPGAWSVQRGHDLAERIEHEIRAALQGAHVITHLKPIEDAVSHSDRELDQKPGRNTQSASKGCASLDYQIAGW